MKNVIFLTGGTGFLGTEIAAGLIPYTDCTVYVLVRADDRETALHRLKAAWHPFPDLYQQIGTHFLPIPGDFTQPDLGLKSSDKALLLDEVTHIFHVGAEVGLQKSESELKRTNLTGTRQMLWFASEIQKKRGLARFLYLSTAYVAGQKTGRILEEAPLSEQFSSLYEKSKAQAEQLVRSSGLPYSICRPGMIIGDSQTGWVRNFNTIYYVLRLLLTGKLSTLPVSKSLRLNLVPVDYVAKSAITIGMNEAASGQTFHLTCPESKQPTAKELIDYVAEWAKENLDLNLSKVRFISAPLLKQAGLTYNRKTKNRKKSFLSNLLTLMPYFYGDQIFDRKNTDAFVAEEIPDWHSYIDRILTFACRKNFMQQTERTVFEQAMVRRESRSYPMRYYDVSQNGIRCVKGPEVNSCIRKITNALYAWGIRKGDKIALTGINCIDYMTLDMAIGRIGAVSVPIYYTAPAAEIDLLLNRSGAKWFFVGDRRIMEQIYLLHTDARIVSFSNALTISNPKVVHWKKFLAAGQEKDAQILPPDPNELATIRYTSGTTGEPKGVMFDFHQLTWMGEVLTNLLPWEERNKSLRYLSFLPQSHVVEGILASYAPYYMLCNVDFYYLNDFPTLAEMLPKVRPTVFFSVPRFYEKLWDQLSANPFGKKYLSMPDGPAKRQMAALLRRIILKKAGLDACHQLIVGSAPMSEELLMNFRALGIEIYNAYGQTEAPLITINRLGDNEIPTIGTPLPDTEVTINSDGELIVRGPQVSLGYYGLETDTIRDGVLKTGDLGSFSESGHILLQGRKKEMIITSYGKNINCPKIEECLKNIPGVSEAVLIGENRPYCTALLWLEDDISNLDLQIEKMNESLSHPEQIRKYKIIPKALSISDGELTPNLKVKRAVVNEHFKQEIEDMYL